MHRLLNRVFVPVVKGLEGLITIIHICFYLMYLSLTCLGIAGTAYQPDMRNAIFEAYIAEFCVVVLEIVLILLQRLYIQAAAPIELGVFKEILSGKNNVKRFNWRYIGRIFLQTPVLFLVFFISEYFRKYWLGELYAEWWGKFVSCGNFMIPFLSSGAQFLHMKVWNKISDSWHSSAKK